MPVRGMAGIAVDDRHILLAGGYAASFSASLLIYDTEADSYSPAGELPIAAANLALVRTGTTLLCIGGEDRMKSRSPRVFATTLLR
jgi:N-acetylneuraminic acid mutarotase